MKCIILAAGYAIRLYPLTLDRPKPLLPIAGKPMIEHILEKLEKLDDVEEVIIITNNKFFDNFRNWKRKYSFSKPIKIINDKTNSDEDKLGAIGDLDFAIKNEKLDGNIFVVAGDNLFKFDLNDLFDFFNEKKSSVIALYDIKDKSLAAGKYGVVELDENKKVTNLEEKPKNPKTTLASTACYILSKENIQDLKECIKKNEKPDNLGDFIRWLAKRKGIYGLTFKEKWFDIGSQDQFKEADKEWSIK